MAKSNSDFLKFSLWTILFGGLGYLAYKSLEEEPPKANPIPDPARFLDRKEVGIECKMAAAIHIFKSLGLIHPAMTRVEFENEFTYILDRPDAKVRIKPSNKAYTIPRKHNLAIRGILDSEIIKHKGNLKGETNQVVFTPNSFKEIAEGLKRTAYAHITQMQIVPLKLKFFKDKLEAIQKIVALKCVAHFNYFKKSSKDNLWHSYHYGTLVGYDKEKKLAIIDDPLYGRIYENHPKITGLRIANFWTILPANKRVAT